MLDLTKWNTTSVVDELAVELPSAVDHFIYNDAVQVAVLNPFTDAGRWPTLPGGLDGVRLSWIADPDVEERVNPSYYRRISGQVDWAADTSKDMQLSDDLIPFPIDRSVELEERYFIGRSRYIVVPKPGREDEFDWKLRLRYPHVYIRADAAEIIHAITLWHTGSSRNDAARDLLDRTALIRYSERMQDPRYRQALCFWTKPNKTAGELVEELLASTDVLPYWSHRSTTLGHGLRLSIRDPRDVQRSTIPLEVSDDDPGIRMFLVDNLNVRTGVSFRVASLRRACGTLVQESGVFGTPSCSAVQSALEGGENVLELVDQDSIDKYGPKEVEETVLAAGDWRSVQGPFRIGQRSAPPVHAVFGMGPLVFDLAPTDIINPHGPDYGVSSADDMQVRRIRIDLNNHVAVVQSLRFGTSSPTIAPAELGDLLLHWVADDYDYEPTIYATWPDRSGNGYAGSEIAALGNEPSKVLNAIGSRPGVRFNNSALEIPNLVNRGTAFPYMTGKQYLTAALISEFSPADAGAGKRFLWSTDGGRVRYTYNVNADGETVSTSFNGEVSAGLGDTGGVEGLGWREDQSNLVRSDIPPYTLPPPALLDQFDGPVITNGHGPLIVVFEMYAPPAAVEAVPAGVFVEPYRHAVGSYSAVFDAVTGDLVGAKHDMRFGYGWPKAIAQRTVVGGNHYSTPADAAVDDVLGAMLHELAIFERELESKPWMPGDIEGLVNYLRSSWGFV